jgi:formylglycine-generating enzyme required for sulfatase activity
VIAARRAASALLLLLAAARCTLDREGDLRGAADAAASATGTWSAAASSAGSGAQSSGTSGSAGQGGAASDGGRLPATCPTLPGPSMVAVAHPSGSFCIDATEVTSKQYEAFLAAVAAQPPVMPAGCEDKTDFTPRTSENQCSAWHYDPAGLFDRPVACVDWCDAYAYCSWAGKRLCGRPGGGAAVFGDAQHAENEWHFACSLGWTRAYPYGNAYDAMACKGDDWDGVQNGAQDEAVDVATLPGCQGGFPGLFDLSGNVMEWENACADSTPDATCHDRGGSFWDGGRMMGCEDLGPTHHTRRYVNKNIGFRCCGNPVE